MLNFHLTRAPLQIQASSGFSCSIASWASFRPGFLLHFWILLLSSLPLRLVLILSSLLPPVRVIAALFAQRLSDLQAFPNVCNVRFKLQRKVFKVRQSSASLYFTIAAALAHHPFLLHSASFSCPVDDFHLASFRAFHTWST